MTMWITSHLLCLLSLNLAHRLLLLYGKYYTKVTLFDDTWSGKLWGMEPWRFVFKEVVLPVCAPLLYRLCELTVHHWDYNGSHLDFVFLPQSLCFIIEIHDYKLPHCVTNTCTGRNLISYWPSSKSRIYGVFKIIRLTMVLSGARWV